VAFPALALASAVKPGQTHLVMVHKRDFSGDMSAEEVFCWSRI